jgi:hypothetical protein
VILGGLVLLGLLLRLPLLGSALAGDELGTYYVVSGHGLGRTLSLITSEQEVTPPLYFILTWLAARLGDPTVALRIVPLMAGLATIPLTYRLGLRTVGGRAGLVGATLAAVSPMLMFYSTEARAYAVVTLLALSSTLALLAAVRTRRRRWWLAYAAASLAALYTHYTGGFVLVVQLAWVLLAHPDARRPALLVNVGVAAGFAPWVPEFLEDGSSACSHIIAQLHPFGVRTLVDDVTHLAIGHPYFGLDSAPGYGILLIFGLVLVLAVAGLAPDLRRRRPSSPEVLIAGLALGTVALAAVYSALGGNSIFSPRNLLTAFPALAVGLGALLGAVPGARLRLGVTIVAIAAMAAAAARMLSPINQRPDYNGIARFISDSSRPGDPVVDADLPGGPGPYQPATVALLNKGRGPGVLPAIYLHVPRLADLLAARDAGPAAPCTSQLQTPEDPAAAARRATALAHNGTIFLIAYGGLGPDELAASDPTTGRFLAALPPRFTVSESRRFRGVDGRSVSVYVLRDR